MTLDKAKIIPIPGITSENLASTLNIPPSTKVFVNLEPDLELKPVTNRK